METREIKYRSHEAVPKILRLLPDQSRLFCYTQVPFEEGEDYRIFEPKLNFISLERPCETKLYSKATFRAVAANIKFLNSTLQGERLCYYLGYVAEHHFDDDFTEDDIQEVAAWVTELFSKGKLRANGRPRHIVFKPGSSLTTEQKRTIIGQICGKSRIVEVQSMYDYIEGMQDSTEPITLSDVAKELKSSHSTVKKSCPSEVKGYLSDINYTIRLNREVEKYNTAVKALTEEGKPVTDKAIKMSLKLSGTRFKEVKQAAIGGTERDK